MWRKESSKNERTELYRVMKKIVVIYDIIEDRVREEIVESLLSFSFVRIQNSVFMGRLKDKKVKEFKNELSKKINITEDKLFILNLCEKCYNKRVFINTKDLSELFKPYYVM